MDSLKQSRFWQPPSTYSKSVDSTGNKQFQPESPAPADPRDLLSCERLLNKSRHLLDETQNEAVRLTLKNPFPNKGWRFLSVGRLVIAKWFGRQIIPNIRKALTRKKQRKRSDKSQ